MSEQHSIYGELKWREMIYDSMDGLEELLEKEKVTLYNGFDPTADSLHVGHLVPMLALARFQRYGHHVIALAGEGTGMIGDPSGRSDERNLLSAEEAHYNVEKIKRQLAKFLDFEIKSNPARIMNNGDWLLDLKLIDFLRDTGKYFTVNSMMAKDSVKSRLSRESGLSFTEFSYSLLQAYDFYHLFVTENCVLQTGGSDQWGNITAGCELIRRKTGKNAYGLTYPLVKKKDGTKFGKTAGGAVWLDPERTSPYKFYQFWLNTDDADVIPFLKYFTFFDRQKIDELEFATRENPEGRAAQKALAVEMTKMMHGETALDKAMQASEALFGGEINGLSAADIKEIFADVPSGVIAADSMNGEGLPIVNLLSDCGFMKSKGEVKRAIAEGGVYINNHRVTDVNTSIRKDQFIEGKYLVLRRGKKNYFLLKTEQE
ncbi:MAG TPA: tyrosine--tRNA ligase [Flexilinea sp.]|jgi:tyrosyl-tRNA synthetase|nr:tyrosine--tRNA ligase [Flexilinea sp.]HOU19232.1 tyrosine--tRNA ligase [Flexilinea sp.]HPL57482.1 tyrosine--tRNA ligase [Flexilinea sp.]HQF80276.1 tyrosine--tRNA ligase [Flexilinea sp.]HQG89083.1 tyrosine--tRNA ligase [Flexilinea sp.]